MFDIELLTEKLAQFAFKFRWNEIYGKRNKYTYQSLFTHSKNNFNVVKVLGTHLIAQNAISEYDFFIALAGSFLSDMGKARPDVQQKFIQREFQDKKFGHHLDEELIRYVISKKDEIKMILEPFEDFLCQKVRESDWFAYVTQDIVRVIAWHHDKNDFHMNPSSVQSYVGGSPHYIELIRFSDALVSQYTLEDVEKYLNWRNNDNVQYMLSKGFKFTHFRLGIIRGHISVVLIKSLDTIIQKQGWRPLLFYPNGTVYVSFDSQDTEISIRSDELLEEIQGNYRDIILSDEDNVNSLVYGSVTGKAIKDIRYLNNSNLISYKNNCFKFRNKKPGDLRQFLKKKKENLEHSVKAINVFIKSINANIQNNQNKLEEINEDTIAENNLALDIFSKVNIMKNSLIYLKGVINGILEYNVPGVTEEGINNIIHQVDQNIDISLMVSSTPYYTLIEALTKVIGFDHTTNRLKPLQNAVDKFYEILETIWIRYNVTEYLPPLIAKEEIQPLLFDVVYPTIIGAVSQEFYSSNAEIRNFKRQSTICAFCCQPSKDVGSASDLGAGSQKFTNHLEGLANIGGQKKAHICPICLLEAKIRNLAFKSVPSEIILVLPEQNQTATMSDQWKKQLKLFTLAGRFNVDFTNSFNIKRFEEELVVNDLDLNKISGELILQLSSDSILYEKQRSELKKYLKGEIDWSLLEETKLGEDGLFPEFIKYAYYKGFNEIAEPISQLKLKQDRSKFDQIKTSIENLDEDDKSEICNIENLIINFLKTDPVVKHICQIENYYMIVKKYPFEKEEDLTAQTLRKLWFGTLISVLFNGAVIYLDSFNPLLQFNFVHSCQTSLTSLAKDYLVKWGLREKAINLHERDYFLRKLAAVDVLLNYLGGDKKRLYGKNSYHLVHNKSEGLLLNRLQQKTGEKGRIGSSTIKIIERIYSQI